MPTAAVGGEGGLEGGDIWAVDEGAAVDQLGDIGEDLLLKLESQ